MTPRSQEFTTPGADFFNVPIGVSLVLVTMIAGGGGGGGGSNGNLIAAGGGSGEFTQRTPYFVTGGTAIATMVGSGGVGGTGQHGMAIGTNGGNGTLSSFGSLIVLPGAGGNLGIGAGVTRAIGGGPGGGAVGLTTGGLGVIGRRETPTHWGGGSSGGRNTVGTGIGTRDSWPGADGINAHVGGIGGMRQVNGVGGSGGAASPWGDGGNGGDCINPAPPLVGSPGTGYGTGGGGGGSSTSAGFGIDGGVNGGAGAGGYILVEWVET